jgi:hypothetical protein
VATWRFKFGMTASVPARSVHKETYTLSVNMLSAFDQAYLLNPISDRVVSWSKLLLYEVIVPAIFSVWPPITKTEVNCGW